MMKSVVLLLFAVALCQAAPVEEQEASAKTKRGLHLGFGYHAPLVTHSYVAPAPVYHAAPLIAHAPVIAHSPLISHSILPAYHSFHHF